MELRCLGGIQWDSKLNPTRLVEGLTLDYATHQTELQAPQRTETGDL